MQQLSIGGDSTLGNYKKLCNAFFGPDSKATIFISDKIKEQGEDEEVIFDESQMVYLLTQMHLS